MWHSITNYFRSVLKWWWVVVIGFGATVLGLATDIWREFAIPIWAWPALAIFGLFVAQVLAHFNSNPSRGHQDRMVALANGVERQTIIRCRGTGKDLQLIGIDNPSPNRIWNYELDDIEIRLAGTKAELSGTIRMLIPGESAPRTCELRAKGSFIDGIAYLEYSKREITKDLSWIGLVLLTIPRAGNISGYWITESIAQKGITVLGNWDLVLVDSDADKGAF